MNVLSGHSFLSRCNMPASVAMMMLLAGERLQKSTIRRNRLSPRYLSALEVDKKYNTSIYSLRSVFHARFLAVRNHRENQFKSCGSPFNKATSLGDSRIYCQPIQHLVLQGYLGGWLIPRICQQP